MFTKEKLKRMLRLFFTFILFGVLLIPLSKVEAATATRLPAVFYPIEPLSAVRKWIDYKENIFFKKGEFIPGYRTMTIRQNGATYTGTIKTNTYANEFAPRDMTVTYEGTLYTR